MYRGITLLILTLLVLAALYVPMTIPYDLVSRGGVQPTEEWLLAQDPNGTLYSSHHNFKTGIVQRLASWKFQPGDLSGMEVTVRTDTFGTVRAGDPVVRMYSSTVQQEILDLENQLKTKQSEQRVLVTGEKPPIVQEAESKLGFAKEALTLREKEYAVAKQLLADQVIARMEYVRAENALQLARIDIKTAEQALAVAETGMKKESVALNTTEMANLQRKLDFLRQRNAGYVITSPFNGVVCPVRAIGEVLILQRVSECIVQIPVKAEEMIFVGDSTQLEVMDAVTKRVYHAKILSKSAQTQVLDGRSVGFVTAVISPPDPSERITLGLSAQCKLHCGNLNQRDYLRRILKFREK